MEENDGGSETEFDMRGTESSHDERRVWVQEN